jgi:RNA polymerase sigma-70 factor (ECF subfamily)
MVANACLPLDRCGGDIWGADEATDEELILRTRRGDGASAFESLVHRYERELFGYLRRYLGNAEMAEDVFQLTFLQVHLKRECFEDGRRFRPWLYAIATNQAIDAKRRNRRHHMVSLDHSIGDDAGTGTLLQMLAGADPADHVADDPSTDPAAADWVRAAVANLPEPLKAVLTLVYQQGLKYREAADVLGLPVGTVKSRLHGGIRRLSQSWQRRPRLAGTGE